MIKVCSAQRMVGIIKFEGQCRLMSYLITHPFARPPGGGLRNHEISQKFIGKHILITITLKTTRKLTNWAKPFINNLYFES